MFGQVRALIPEAGDGEGVDGAVAAAELRLPALDEPADLALDLRQDAVRGTDGALMPPEPTHDPRGDRRGQEDGERLKEADDEIHLCNSRIP